MQTNISNRSIDFNKVLSEVERDSEELFMWGDAGRPIDEIDNYANGVGIARDVDPDGLDQHEDGAKLDGDKPDCSLLSYFGLALTEVAKVGTFGAKKYSRGGWQHVDDGFNRYSAAMLRHYFQENYEDIDEDSQMFHIAQTAWNALARLEYFLREKKEEERKKDAPIHIPV